MALATKLASLLIKTLAKPLAARIKDRAQQAESFRSFCVGMGRFVNKTSMQLQILASGHIPREIKPLSEKKAVNRGADFLGEAIIFGIGGALIAVEVTRSALSAEAKAADEAERKRSEAEAMEKRFRALELRMLALQDDMRRIEGMTRIVCEGRLHATAGGAEDAGEGGSSVDRLASTTSGTNQAMAALFWPLRSLGIM